MGTLDYNVLISIYKFSYPEYYQCMPLSFCVNFYNTVCHVIGFHGPHLPLSQLELKHAVAASLQGRECFQQIPRRGRKKT